MARQKAIFAKNKTVKKKGYSFEFKLLCYVVIIAVFSALVSILFNFAVYNGLKLVKTYTAGNTYKSIAVIGVTLLIFYIAKISLKLTGSYGVRAVKHEITHIDRKMMSPRGAISKICLTGLSIVTGFSVGTFGPTVHIGGFIGSQIAYFKKMDSDKVRVLIGAGVAASLSAVLRTPLFAAVVVLELFFLDKRFDYIFPILTGSVVAISIDMYILGAKHVYGFSVLFQDIKNTIATPEAEVLFLVVLVIGLTTGVFAITYIKLLHSFEKLHAKLGKKFYLIICAGLVTIVFSLLNSKFLYLDMDFITKDFVLQHSFTYLLVLAFGKLLITCVQLGLGVHGGNFKPGIYLGLLFGLILFKFLDLYVVTGISFSLVILLTMTAMLSGFIKAPLSAVILAVEVSNSAKLILPLIAISLTAYFVNLFVLNKDINSEV